VTSRVVAIVPPAFVAFRGAPQSSAATRRHVIVQDIDSLRRELPHADVLVLAPRFGEMIRDVWPQAQHLRWIHSLGAGVEKFPFDLLRQSDVVVTNSKGVYADALAEFVIAAILWFAKDMRRLAENQATRKWVAVPVLRVEGTTMGIIGYGSIGAAIGRRAEGLGMRLLTARRSGGVPIGELIAASDYIAVSTPLTSETRHLLNRDRIALMRPDAVLINVSRGAVVDERALTDALAARRIRGAALDVFEIEPLPADSPLWSLDNVLVSPHSADRTRDSPERAVAFFRTNLERFERGEPLLNGIDKEASY